MAERTTYALITGGSSGIGKAIARECAGRKIDLLLVALETPELEQTAVEIREKFSVKVATLGIDLTQPGAPLEVHKWCMKNSYRVRILVNNAGIAGAAEFERSSPEYSDERIMLNVRAPVLLSRLFIPELKKLPGAHILNTGSLSAYYPIAYKSVYAASKAFVLSFSRALRRELSGSGIGVTVVNPNGVRTNTGTYGRIDSHGKKAGMVILPAERVAKIAIDGMMKGKTVIVPGFWNRVLLFISLLIPVRIREKRIARMFRKELTGSVSEGAEPGHDMRFPV